MLSVTVIHTMTEGSLGRKGLFQLTFPGLSSALKEVKARALGLILS